MKLSKENYETVLGMLNSSDKENKLVGLTCIENSDFNKNFVLIMFLYKNSQALISDWENDAPKTYRKITGLTGEDKSFITYRLIFEQMLKKKGNKEDVEFFIENFNKFLIDTLNKRSNYPEIESINVKFKDLE